MRAARTAFESVAQILRTQGSRAALDAAERLVLDLRRVGKDLKTHYSEVVLGEKLEALDAHRDEIERGRRGEAPPSELQIQALLTEIGKTIHDLNGEVRRLVPIHLTVAKWVTRHRTRVIQGAAVLLVLPFLWMAGKTLVYWNNGLRGEYYSDTDFTKLFGVRTDKKIVFRWSGKSPMPGLPSSNYSVRWLGTLRIPKDGRYSFAADVDDGVEVSINQQVVVRAERRKKKAPGAGAIQLAKGTYPIEIKYYQVRGPAYISVRWKMPGRREFKPIATEYLRIPSGLAPRPLPEGESGSDAADDEAKPDEKGEDEAERIADDAGDEEESEE